PSIPGIEHESDAVAPVSVVGSFLPALDKILDRNLGDLKTIEVFVREVQVGYLHAARHIDAEEYVDDVGPVNAGAHAFQGPCKGDDEARQGDGPQHRRKP